MTQKTLLKSCPGCATVIPVTRSRCECGYLFSGTPDPAGWLTGEEGRKADEVYEFYLTARIKHILKSVRLADNERLTDPTNPELIAQLKRLKQQIRILQAQRVIHSEKISVRPNAAGMNSQTPTQDTGHRLSRQVRRSVVAERIKLCPSCSATLSPSATRCLCGQALPETARVPAPFVTGNKRPATGRQEISGRG